MELIRRVRLFVFMAAWLPGAPSAWAHVKTCVAADLTGMPLNVRTTPKVKIFDTAPDGLRERIAQAVRGMAAA